MWFDQLAANGKRFARTIYLAPLIMALKDICAMQQRLRLCIFLLLSACLSGAADADILTTPHSLINKSAKNKASDACLFCHTPALSGQPPENAPLWQPSIGTNLAFTIYDDIGRLGLDKPSVGSQSIACLSCHDANQALSVMKQSADHPFGIPYRGATKNLISSPQKAASKPGDATAPAWAMHLSPDDGFRDPSQGIVENRTVWWVSTSGVSARRTRNDLPLYERYDTESGRDLPFIECSSCHDPHSNTPLFLRLPNTGSQLCLACHVK